MGGIGLDELYRLIGDSLARCTLCAKECTQAQTFHYRPKVVLCSNCCRLRDEIETIISTAVSDGEILAELQDREARMFLRARYERPERPQWLRDFMGDT